MGEVIHVDFTNKIASPDDAFREVEAVLRSSVVKTMNETGFAPQFIAPIAEQIASQTVSLVRELDEYRHLTVRLSLNNQVSNVESLADAITDALEVQLSEQFLLLLEMAERNICTAATGSCIAMAYLLSNGK